MSIGKITSERDIVVNQFKFCARHGDELCQTCCCDHRMSNNVMIEEELSHVSEFLETEVEVSSEFRVVIFYLRTLIYGAVLCILTNVLILVLNNIGIPRKERQPLNAYALGAFAALHTQESFQCENHKTVDCSTCFDWIFLIKREAEEVEESGRWMSKRNSLQEKLESGVLIPLGNGAATTMLRA